MSTILVVAAHPDDEIIGCAGVCMKSILKGSKVAILILGEGISSRYNKREDAPIIDLKALSGKAQKVSQELGAYYFKHASLPDNRFDSIPLLDIIKVIEAVKKDVQPDVVYTHHHSDLNIDHQITFKAVLSAFRPKIREKCKKIYSFEVPSATDYQFQSSVFGFHPNTFEELSEEIVLKKIKIMSIYDSEIVPHPQSRSLQGLQNLMAMRGNMVGLEYAETYELIRDIQ